MWVSVWFVFYGLTRVAAGSRRDEWQSLLSHLGSAPRARKTAPPGPHAGYWIPRVWIFVWKLRDARDFAKLPESWMRIAETLSGARFQWTKWCTPGDEWTHDHCTFCSACICNHRERHPARLSMFRTRGCFGHAFRAVDHEGSPVWICRSCFKALRNMGNWAVLRRSGIRRPSPQC
jgi:hypothetical protein